MEKYKILTGENLSEEIYLKTWELDNETFEDKDKLSKEMALEWFYSSEKSTIVLWNDEENELVGYLTPFLLKHKFASDYIISNINYKTAINPSTFCKRHKNSSGDIYIFSTVISSKYRDKVLEAEDKNSKYYNKKAFKILNEELVNWIYNLKKDGINIKYVFAEKVNLVQNDSIPVILGGETCDPDDRYFLQDKNVKINMPKINDGEELYIAIFSVGAYQEMLSGIGGVHHCMIPEGKELIIYKNSEGKIEYYEPKSGQEALSLLDYDKMDYISKFI